MSRAEENFHIQTGAHAPCTGQTGQKVNGWCWASHQPSAVKHLLKQIERAHFTVSFIHISDRALEKPQSLMAAAPGRLETGGAAGQTQVYFNEAYKSESLQALQKLELGERTSPAAILTNTSVQREMTKL